MTVIPLTSYLHLENHSLILFFAFNFAMGWLVVRQGSLAGVILIHFVLGAFSKYLQLI